MRAYPPAISTTADTVLDQAWIDFTNSAVYDTEDSAIESTFTGAGNIGFYLTLASEGGGSIFSSSSLN